MAFTKLSERTSHKLSDKEREFADQYLVDLDGAKAAIRTGYSVKAAAVTASKILAKPHVKAYIGKQLSERHEEVTLTTAEVLKQLFYIVTRDVREFVDDEGVALPISELGDRAAQSVDGFDQEITEYTDMNTGMKTRTIKNKLKLVGKAGAIDMAMKYQGLFIRDNEQKVPTVTLDFSQFFKPPKIDASDPVEKAMAHLEETAQNKVIIEAEPNKKPQVKEAPIKASTKLPIKRKK